MTDSILWSDAIGIVASLVLIIPAGKDNFYRFREASQRKKQSHDRTPLREYVVEAWRKRRDSFSAWDSFFMILGGLGLAATFILKMLGL